MAAEVPPKKEEDKNTQQFHIERTKHSPGVSPKFINRIVEDSKPESKTPKNSSAS